MADQVEQNDEHQKAEEALEKHEKAQETIKNLEDDPPKDLEEWPDDEAKYLTFGGAEGDHSYDEGPEAKLGPSSLERKHDGKVEIEGEEVDDPDEYKGEPIPGGPTDPEGAELAGERKRKEKEERMYGGPGEPGMPREEYQKKRQEEGDGQPQGEAGDNESSQGEGDDDSSQREGGDDSSQSEGDDDSGDEGDRDEAQARSSSDD
jgi:hypothetical protein